MCACVPQDTTPQPFLLAYLGNLLARVPGRGPRSAQHSQNTVAFWKEGARRFCIFYRSSLAAPLGSASSRLDLTPSALAQASQVPKLAFPSPRSPALRAQEHSPGAPQPQAAPRAAHQSAAPLPPVVGDA